VLGAHPAEAGIAFHTLILIDGRPIRSWIDMDRPHRTDRDAIAACDAFLWINNHRTHPNEFKLQLFTEYLKGGKRFHHKKRKKTKDTRHKEDLCLVSFFVLFVVHFFI
jgi:hypothetical protein